MSELPMPGSLGIVFFTRDMARSAILSSTDSSPFFIRHDPVGLRPILHTVDPVLLAIQAVGLPLIQLAAGNALIDQIGRAHV